MTLLVCYHASIVLQHMAAWYRGAVQLGHGYGNARSGMPGSTRSAFA